MRQAAVADGGPLPPPPSTSGRPWGAPAAASFMCTPSLTLEGGRRAVPLPLPPASLSLALDDARGRVLALLPGRRGVQAQPAPKGGGRGAAPPRRARRLPPALARAARYTRHLAAGAASCAVTRTALAPLERVKLDQVLHSRPVAPGAAAAAAARRGFRATVAALYAQGGVASFWAGNGVNLLRTCPHKAVNFFAFDTYRRALLARPGRVAPGADPFGAGDRFLAGALAGMTATALCFPLDVLRTRIMAAGGPAAAGGLRAATAAVVATEGARGLYVGLAPALAATAPSGAIFYGTYDVVKEAYLRAAAARTGARPAAVGPRETLAFGALAGAAAELALYPAEVVRRRMQLDAAAASAAVRAAARAGGAAAAAAARAAAPRASFRGAAAALAAERGVAAFYAGLGANMLQVLPSAALSYYAYECFKAVLDVDEKEG